MNYKVSILVSICNEGPYIERCARSLFEQTYSDLEYIFVDDCSTDNSLNILKRVMAEYSGRKESVKIIQHKVNRGLAAVRNTALDHAVGEFICFMDGDDWMEPDGIECLVEEQVATNADVVWGKALMHTDDKEVELSEPKYKDVEEWRMCYFNLDGLVLVEWRRIIRRSLLEHNHIRHEEGLHIGNDKQFMPLVAYYAHSFSSVDAVVYHYNRTNPKAHTYINNHGGYDLTAYTKDIESVNRVIRFLSDKNPVYYEAAQYAKLRLLVRYRDIAVWRASRKGFKVMMKWIMETPAKYRKQIGWMGLKMLLKSNYSFCRVWFLVKNSMNHN